MKRLGLASKERAKGTVTDTAQDRSEHSSARVTANVALFDCQCVSMKRSRIPQMPRHCPIWPQM